MGNIYITHPNINHIGIYQLPKRQMAFELGYPIDTVDVLMKRFTEYYKLIRYHPEMRELAIKNWGKYKLYEASGPMLDCMISELKDVCDPALIPYVSESIQDPKIGSLYESF